MNHLPDLVLVGASIGFMAVAVGFCGGAVFRIRRALGLCRNRKRPARRTLRAVATTPLTFEPLSWGRE